MTVKPESGVKAAGQFALDALYAENRASADRLRACFALHQLCVDEQMDRDIAAGYYDPDTYPDSLGPDARPSTCPGSRPSTRPGAHPSHAEIDPLDIACAELVARYGVHHHRASAMLKIAIDLVQRFPAMITEMESGWLDERTASMLSRHMRTVDSTVRDAVQRAVLDWLRSAIAAGERPGRDAILARTDHIIREHDPAGVLARRESALRERHVRVRRRPDGMADLTAHLSAAEASSISSVLDAATKEAIERDKAARIDAVRRGDTPDEARENGAGPFLGERSNGERRADALVDALLGANSVDSGPQIRPEITVLAPLGPDGEPEAHFPRGGPASIDALIALLSRSVGSSISLIDPTPGAADTVHGAARYRISADLARRIRLRDGTCRHPGCSEPAENCDIDHVRPFNHSDPSGGGPTTEKNLMCLCRRHHRFKTFHKWRYQLAPDGTLTVTTDSGHTISTRPNGPLSQWRERTADASTPAPSTAPAATPVPTPQPTPTPGTTAEAAQPSRPWLKPGPRSTDWHRRACRLAAERQRNIEAMHDERRKELRERHQWPESRRLEWLQIPGSLVDPEFDPDPPPF